MRRIIYALTCFAAICFGCSSEQINSGEHYSSDENQNKITPTSLVTLKILSLGDSYTIGQSVCETCKFPEQLKDRLLIEFGSDKNFELKVIALTGWTTTNLIDAINSETIDEDYNLVTLLIGVNNQYQGIPFSVYETEFPKLINIATTKSKGNKSKLIVISIPDYAFTPYGNGNGQISMEIEKYNDFAKKFCESNNITFVNITDITRMGLDNPDLVASDGLHPSKLAYGKFVERILPLAIEKLKN